MDPSNPNYYVATDKDRDASMKAKAELRGETYNPGGVTYTDAGGYPISIDPRIADAKIAAQNAAERAASNSEQGMSQRPSGYGQPASNPFVSNLGPSISNEPTQVNAQTQTVITQTKPGYRQETNVNPYVSVTTSRDFASPFSLGTSQMVNNPINPGLVMSGQAIQNAKYAPVNFEATRANLPMAVSEGVLEGVSFGAFGLTKSTVGFLQRVNTPLSESETRQSLAMNKAGQTAVILPRSLTLVGGTTVSDVVTLTTGLAVGGVTAKYFGATAEYNKPDIRPIQTSEGSAQMAGVLDQATGNINFKAVAGDVKSSGVINQPKEFLIAKQGATLPAGKSPLGIETIYPSGRSFVPVELQQSFSKTVPIESVKTYGPIEIKTSTWTEFKNMASVNREGGPTLGEGIQFANQAKELSVFGRKFPLGTKTVLNDVVSESMPKGQASFMDIPRDTEHIIQIQRGETYFNVFGTDYAQGLTQSVTAVKVPTMGSGGGGRASVSPVTPGGDLGSALGGGSDAFAGLDLGKAQASGFGLSGLGGSAFGYNQYDLEDAPVYHSTMPERNPLNTPINARGNSISTSSISPGASIFKSDLGTSPARNFASGVAQISSQPSLTPLSSSLQVGLQSQTGMQSQTQLQTQTRTQLTTGLQLQQSVKFESRLSPPIMAGGFESKAFSKRLTFTPNLKGGMKRDKSYSLPTADLFSIDRTFRKFGKVQFTSSPKGRAAFAKVAGNPLASFPTAQEFKGGFRI